MPKDYSIQEIQQEFESLLNALQSAQLATLDQNKLPQASYAPYLRHENSFYFYLSDLANHAKNLKNNPTISLMFIEDEGKSRNIFARRRIIIYGSSFIVERGTAVFDEVLGEFKHRFGDFIDVIQPLTDFNLFQIKPDSGRFIRGFAQAFELSGSDLKVIRHISTS